METSFSHKDFFLLHIRIYGIEFYYLVSISAELWEHGSAQAVRDSWVWTHVSEAFVLDEKEECLQTDLVQKNSPPRHALHFAACPEQGHAWLL